jgi:hypothetical protein
MSRLISQRLHRGRSKPGTESSRYTRLMILARERERLTTDVQALESRLATARGRLIEIDREMTFLQDATTGPIAPSSVRSALPPAAVTAVGVKRPSSPVGIAVNPRPGKRK